MGNKCCGPESIPVQEEKAVVKEKPTEKKPEKKISPEPVKKEPPKETPPPKPKVDPGIALCEERTNALETLKAELQSLPCDGFFEIKSIQDMVFKVEYFQKFFPNENMFILDYDDRDSSKSMFVTACKVEEEKYEGKELGRNDHTVLYACKEVCMKDDVKIMEETFPGLIMPFVDDEGGIFRLLVLKFASKGENFDRAMKEDVDLLKEVCEIYSKAYLMLDIRFKFFVLAEEACEWLKMKMKKDAVHIGFFYKSAVEKFLPNGVCWCAGTTEESFCYERSLWEVFDNEKVTNDEYTFYKIDPKVKVFGEDLIGVLKFDGALVDHEHETAKYTVQVLEKCIKLAEDEEEKDEIDNDEDDDDDVVDEGEESDEEHENEDVVKKLFFEAIILRIEKKLHKLERKDKAELLSFSKPPVGVHEVNKAVLSLLGVSRKSMADWNRTKTIMKTKYRFNFKILKELDFSNVSKSRREKAMEQIKDLTYSEILEVNYATSLLYVFAEAILIYGRVLTMRDEDFCRFSNLLEHHEEVM